MKNNLAKTKSKELAKDKFEKVDKAKIEQTMR